MKKEAFGTLPDGRAVHVYTLSQPGISTVRITDYGGILLSWLTPDAGGGWTDIVLGFDTLEEYLAPHPYMGSIVGRYANRIAHGQFSLNGHRYQLACNLPPHHLHGGTIGFDKALWTAYPGEAPESLVLSHHSPSGDEAFPGNLHVKVIYTLSCEGCLRIDFFAHTDEPTVVNLTHHAYFNLAGGGSVLDHLLKLEADEITATDAHLIPTGQMMPVAGTPLDFRQPASLGSRIFQDFEPLRVAAGYDHNFAIRGWDGSLRQAAQVWEARSGRSLIVRSTQPGVQLYTANHLRDLTGKKGVRYEPYTAFCLETQHFPDSPNHPQFPSTLLRPGEMYRHSSEYQVQLLPAGE